MKKIVFTVICVIITWNILAQETIFRRNSKGVLESVEFSENDKRVPIPASAKIFFKDILNAKPTDEFRKIQRKQKRKEFIYEHFEQYHNGVKVEGAGYNFHYKNKKMFFAHGHYVDVNNIITEPSITKNQAIKNFAKHKQIPIKDVSKYIVELIIKEIPEKTDTLPALVYRIYLYANYPQNTEIGFIDAHTGKLRMTEPAFIDFSETGTFATRYSGTQQGITQHYQGAYHLADSTRDAVIHTWNLEGRYDMSSRIELTDNDNNWTQVEHHANNNDMGLDVQWALQNIYDRLYIAHEINSMDDEGFPINAHIRYRNNYDNASWHRIDSALFFGEGKTKFRPLASLDVVAHEFGHGITHFQIGWTTNEQQPFNEGLSDIWGVIMEYRIRPSSVWQIGDQVTLNYDCLRNIQNTNDNNARVKIANTFTSPQYDSGNHYVKGGVFSHWFYLLVNGGNGTNDLGRNYSVYGVGMDLAEELIVKATYNGYLRFTTSYAQIRTSIINAARDIAGVNSFLEHQVANAWYAVGVGDTEYRYFISGPSIICPSGSSFTVDNLPSGFTIEWSQSNNINRDSAQGANPCAFSVNGYGEGWIEAKIKAPNGNTITTLHQTVSVNKTHQGNLSLSLYNSNGPETSYMCPNKHYHIYINNSEGAPFPNYTWSIPSGWTKNYAWSNMISVYTGSSPGGMVEVYADTYCGTNVRVLVDYLMADYDCNNSYYMSISPNPTTGETTISLTSNDTKQPLSNDIEWEMEIYDWSKSLRIKQPKIRGSQYKFNTAKLLTGVYTVRVKIGDQVLTEKLIVK